MAACRVVLALLACVVLPSLATPIFWPQPAFSNCSASADVYELGTAFKITIFEGETPLLEAIKNEYTGILEGVATVGNTTTKLIRAISVKVQSTNTSLHVNTNVSYRVEFDSISNVISINAETAFGARYALETVTQLVENGFSCSSVFIVDEPQFAHRGLMVDVADRFVPVATLQTIVRGLAYSKMNVLNLHFVDNGGARVASSIYPDITDDLNGYYEASDISDLVSYAHTFGVNVVPEVSIPNDAGGFSGIDAVNFCADGTTLYNDPDGKTLGAVTAYIMETLSIFGSTHYFIGGGPTTPSGACTNTSFDALTGSVAKSVLTQAKVLGGYSFLSSISGIPAQPNVHLFSSSTATIDRVLARDYSVIFTGAGHSYWLNSQPSGDAYCPLTTPAKCFYNNLHAISNASGFLGLSASVWTSNYCNKQGCISKNAGSTNPAAFMSSRDQDDVFSSSLLNLIFPRVSVVGAAAWSFVEGQTDVEISRRFGEISRRLSARGIAACACGTCTETKGCSGEYAKFEYDIRTIQAGMALVISLFATLMVVILVALFYKPSGPRSGYTRVN